MLQLSAPCSSLDDRVRLVFAEGGHVDSTFRKLAESLASGPLAETSVTTVRCTTTPLSTVEGQENRYSITVHFPNVYDVEETRSVCPARLPATAQRPRHGAATAHEIPLAPSWIEAYWGEA